MLINMLIPYMYLIAGTVTCSADTPLILDPALASTVVGTASCSDSYITLGFNVYIALTAR